MTQNERLLGWLYENKTISPMEALDGLGIYRLSARILELRKLGYDIKTHKIEITNRYGDICRVAKYVMESA